MIVRNESKPYIVGFETAMKNINTSLVNGLDEFKHPTNFINYLLHTVAAPIDVEIKEFVQGVIDAGLTEWKKAKNDEIIQLTLEKESLEEEYKKLINEKKSA